MKNRNIPAWKGCRMSFAHVPVTVLLLLACLAVLPEWAAGAVFDDFESYAIGSNLIGQGGWAGWTGNPSASALVSTNFSFSPARSVNITGTSDLVDTFSGATNGQWVFSVTQYIPSTSTGDAGVILMNTYRAPYAPADLSWSVQIQCNMDTGQIISDLGGGATLPMLKDQWVEFRCEINLASNSVSEFYNGQLLSTHAWQGGLGGPGLNEIQALDLFANNAAPVYYDNVSLSTNGTCSGSWTERSPLTPSPSAREHHAMAYDSVRGRTVLFGGDGSSYLGDTWEWDGTTWVLKATNGPSARNESAMAYDSAHGVVVLFGGGQNNNPQSNNDTWLWNGTTWTQVFPAVSPSARVRHAMSYDSARGVVVLFGGLDASGSGGLHVYKSDTWEWNGTTWTLVSTNGPSARESHAMAYDSARGKTVLFGGEFGASLGDTWEWNGTTWTQMATTGPTARFDHAMAYESGCCAQTILFGGYDATGRNNDTWGWNGIAWSQVPASGPSVRNGHKMTYDSGRGRLVLFGGYSLPAGVNGETWEFVGCSLTAREHINNHSMLEAMADGYHMIQQEFGLDPASTINWTAAYSETGWTGSMVGTLYNKSLTLNYSGVTIYGANQNATNTFSANGVNGTNAITINGTAVWSYNVGSGGYTNMDFVDKGVVETPKLKWWVVALELVGGGAVGGLFDDGAGVLAGAALGLSASAAVTSITVNGTDPTDPGNPTRPTLPATVNDGLAFVPGTDQLVTRVLGDGTENANVRNHVILSGNWTGGYASGFGYVGSSTNVQFAGLTHTALGGAVLNMQVNQLTVGNLGTNGADGVSIAFNPGVNFVEAHWQNLDPDNSAPVGAFVRVTAIGSFGGQTNQIIGSVQAVNTGTTKEFTANYTPIGSTSQTIEVRDGGPQGILVARVTGHTGPAAQCIRWPFSGHVGTLPGGGIAIDVGWRGFRSSIAIIGGPTVTGDYLCIKPEPDANIITDVSSATITAKGIFAISITDEDIFATYAGFQHSSLGNASLTVQANRLKVGNLGSSGQGGVSIVLSNAIQWAAAWEPLDPNGTALPLGAYLQMQLVGTTLTVTNGVLGTVTATKGTSNSVVSADFSAEGATNLTVQVYDGTNLVGQVAGLPMGTVYSDTGLPFPNMPTDCSACTSYGCDTADFTYAGSQLFTIGNGGPVFSGNRVLIIPQGPPLNGSVSTVNLLASQIPSIIFTNEVVSPLVLNFASSRTNLALNWLGTGQLQQSGNLNTWTDLTNVVSPYVTPIGPTNLFYRIKQTMGDESF